MNNITSNSGAYPYIETEIIWRWLLAGIKKAAAQYPICSISITTHGATAALIDRTKMKEGGLVLPILDYEYNISEHGLSEHHLAEYAAARPDFSESFSPSLPAGLNLGRQIYWLKNQYPNEFSEVTDIVMYPQYWVWRLTGTLCSEITSLGCHTDLWSIDKQDYSSLVDILDIQQLFPPLVPAWFNAGTVTSALQESLGVEASCNVFAGIHDSNASYLRYRLTNKEQPFTVISSGTWTILMAAQAPLSTMDPTKDMLANVDALGHPIACARFMGGREFDSICQQTGASLQEQFTELDLQKVISHQVFALPDFSHGSGPFGGKQGKIIGTVSEVSGIALASIYCALMIDYQLDMLEAKGNIFIEGAFLKNPLLCAMLNQLRIAQGVYLSNDSTGTVQGAAYLTKWDNVNVAIDTSAANTTHISGLVTYKKQWRKLISA